jgi:formylglycine-generating enzyme required for sulfatase activity
MTHGRSLQVTLAAVLLCLMIALGYLALRPTGRQAQVCASSPSVGDSCLVGGIEFLAVPGGDFAMGSIADDASPNEQPVRRVTLDAFWIARTELTFKQWNAFIAESGHPRGRSQAGSDDHPVVSVTWDDAKAFCDWFSRTYGVIVRLPSKAEWEFAARGGLRGRTYPNGDTLSSSQANYASDGPVRVASYPPNGYGLHDMAGNVNEWVSDWYDKDYYATSPRMNPAGPATQPGELQRKADRGGGWCMGIERLRVAARHAGPGSWDQGGTADCLGFRPVMKAGD